MLKNLGVAIVSLFFGVSVFAQQDPQFSQNMFNRFYVNPAVAGSNDAICLNSIARTQWVGFTGAPKTAVFSLHAPVGLLHGGAGLNIATDQIGQFTYTAAKASYAYRHQIGAGTLAAGVSIGMINLAISPFNDAQAIDGVATDNEIPKSAFSDWSMDFDFGVYYHTEQYYVGLSTTHLQKSDLASAATTGVNYTVARHFYLQAGYNFQLNSSIVLQPSIWVKTTGKTFQTDLNCLAVYNNSLYGGVSIRANREIIPMVGYIKPIGNGTLKIGYSYDIALLNNMASYNKGSHEIMLGYCFTITPEPKITKHHTVRFL